MTTTFDGRLNDVDLESVGSLISAVAEDPSRGRTEWESHRHLERRLPVGGRHTGLRPRPV